MPNRQRSGRRIRLRPHSARLLLGPVSLGLLALFCPAGLSSARADSDDGNPQAAWALPQSLPAYLHDLTDTGGLRSRLERQGLSFTFSYYGDAFDNPVGGVKQGPGYDGRFGIITEGDLEKLAGWSGAKFHASIHGIFGTQFSATNLDNLMLVSGVEAPPTIRLFNLWVEQDLTKGVSLRVGQFTAAQEFIVSRNADLFLNSTFGWPMLNTQDLPSGGPNYPEAALGARLQVAFTDQLILRTAIFDGDPAGSGSNNPLVSDKYGVAFRLRDPPFVIAEMVYGYGGAQLSVAQQNPNQEGDGRLAAVDQAGPRLAASPAALPGVVKVGAWYNAGPFPLQDFTQGGPMPPQRPGDAAVYGLFEQTLWRVPSSPNRALGFFVRGVAAPSDRSEVDRYADAGFAFRGPLTSRPEDIVGIAFAYGRISPDAAANDRALAALTGAPMPIRDYEAAIELTYRWKLAESFFIQPDLQYVFHPGANIANPANPASGSAIPNALVLGLRTALQF
jgi:porin